jgi:NADH dehydrogenase (ubiquinone) 1 beta subcomplex subunit 11
MAVWPRLRQFGINSLNFVQRRAGSGNCKGAPPKSRTQQDISAWVKNEESKNWFGYGWVPFDKKLDKIEMHLATAALTAVTIIPIVYFNYRRDGYAKKHWSRREAMLCLIEREKAGVPYIDRNFVDPAKLELPTDEELNGAEVMI